MNKLLLSSIVVSAGAIINLIAQVAPCIIGFVFGPIPGLFSGLLCKIITKITPGMTGKIVQYIIKSN